MAFPRYRTAEPAGTPSLMAARMREWLGLAVRIDVVRRSFEVAVVVGTILVLINYWDRLYPFAITTGDWIKIGLTYCVPYCVATYAAVDAMREAGVCPDA